MISRIYVHNFRCLINFEVALTNINLFLGPNGVGKSTLFDLLQHLSSLISGNSTVADVFKAEDLTRWGEAVNGVYKQQFELDLNGNEGSYQYLLTIEHRPEKNQVRIGSEKLLYNGQPLYEFSALSGKAHFYRDDHSSGGEYLFDWSRSGVAGLQERMENTKLVWFRNRLASALVVRPNPARMGAESRKEERYPDVDLTNFASWYRFLSQERQGQVMELNNALREVIDDFDYLRLKEAGEGKILAVRFTGGREYKFNELSDGQRMLIALYTLLHCLPEEGAILCVDEPENFLALSEIQPWLDELDDCCTEGFHQVLLISHHPRPINFLAADAGLWMDRAGIDQPSRISPIRDDGQGISIARLVERGWIYDA